MWWPGDCQRRGERRVVASISKGMVAGKLMIVKDNLLVILMDVAGLTQWGASWPMERVCGRGGSR